MRTIGHLPQKVNSHCSYISAVNPFSRDQLEIIVTVPTLSVASLNNKMKDALFD